MPLLGICSNTGTKCISKGSSKISLSDWVCVKGGFLLSMAKNILANY